MKYQPGVYWYGMVFIMCRRQWLFCKVEGMIKIWEKKNGLDSRRRRNNFPLLHLQYSICWVISLFCVFFFRRLITYFLFDCNLFLVLSDTDKKFSTIEIVLIYTPKIPIITLIITIKITLSNIAITGRNFRICFFVIVAQ